MADVGVQPALAALVTLLGGILTTTGVLAHIGPFVAPGSLLILVGGGWLGNTLARRNVRILPSPRTEE
jgi:flagellar motor component MotA